ncbi:hypothetical protein [uncultured Sphingomonas sp.]|uniref:hypothetical protein n=1 Tax=uncultured Sphingomonas sp. TaxID=158754 RepID=UPI0035CA6644
MDDTFFSGVAEVVIGYADERFGRIAAWIVGTVLVTAGPVAILAAAIWWYSH